jgi:hypothetical protein
MPSLPILSGLQVVKVFVKDGWQMVRQHNMVWLGGCSKGIPVR